MAEDAGTHGARRDGFQHLAELAVLWAFSVAQPLFSLLGGSPEFWIARDGGRLEVIVFAVVLAAGPPLVLFGIERAVTAVAGRRAGEVLHLVLAGALAALFALYVLVELGASSALFALVAVAAGAGFAMLLVRSAGVRSALRVLAPAPLLLAAYFLVATPTSDLVFASGAPDRPVAAADRVSSDAPVVFIVFDQLPAASLLDARGRIDERAYPNFARLARTSTFHPFTAAVGTQTTKAVPAILSARFPGEDRLPIASQHPDNLFTMFAPTHRLDVHEPVTSLCPGTVCPAERTALGEWTSELLDDLRIVYANVALPEGLRGGTPTIRGGWGDFAENRADDTPETANARAAQAARRDRAQLWREGIGGYSAPAGGRPALHFLHELLPHFPFEYLPSGRRYGGNLGFHPGLDEGSGEWTEDASLVRHTVQRHLLQLRFTDRLLGQALDRLESSGLLDRAAVVVTADHGIAFTPGDSIREISQRNFAEQLGVPLFVKAPGQTEGEVSDEVFQTTDVLPLLARALGSRVPWRHDGTTDPRDEVAARRQDGRVVRFRAAALRAGILAAARRRLAALGSPAADRMFAVEMPELIGRRVAGSAPLDARFDAARALAGVDPGSPLQPAYLAGTVLTPRAPGEAVAVAVDGRVVAVGTTYLRDGRVRFSIPLPEAALRPGANRVELFPAPPLRSGGGPDPGALHVLRDDGIETPDGDLLTFDDRSLDGFVDSAARSGGDIVITGWAAAVAAKRPAGLLIFADGREVRARVRRGGRRDVAESLGDPRFTRSGYTVTLRAAELGSDGQPHIRVFAVDGSSARELPYPAGYEFGP